MTSLRVICGLGPPIKNPGYAYGSKIVLSSSRGQGNIRGLEASRQRPRTSKCVLETKDVLEDSTSAEQPIFLKWERPRVIVLILLYFGKWQIRIR